MRSEQPHKCYNLIVLETLFITNMCMFIHYHLGVGAWQDMVNQRVRPYCRMQVWDACSDAIITFNDDDLGQDLGYIVENDVTIAALSRQLDELIGSGNSGVRVEYETMVTSVEVPNRPKLDEENWVKVELRNGECLRTRLLVAADGANSSIREMCGIDVLKWNYDQSGVVATMHLSEVCFVKCIVLYLLRINHNVVRGCDSYICKEKL